MFCVDGTNPQRLVDRANKHSDAICFQGVGWQAYTLPTGESMGRFNDIALKLGRMFSVIGISNPDEVRRKRLLYQQQRAARLAKQGPPPGSPSNPDTAPPSSIPPKS